MQANFPIAGIMPFSATDWPGKLTASVFTTGCPWACVYCHNPALQDPYGETTATVDELMELLASREGLLDAVVFSGGEPTMHRGLPVVIREVRRRFLALGVGLHTCGYLPSRIHELVDDPTSRPDWVGLDVKALPETLPGVVGCTPAGARNAWESLNFLAEASAAGLLELQVRTTVWHGGILEEQLPRLQEEVASRGLDLVIQWAHDVDSDGHYVGV